MSSELLRNLAKSFESIPDPRSKKGVTHPYHGMIVLVLLGLISGMPNIAHRRR